LHKDNLKVQHLYGDICLKLNFKDEALESYKLLLFLNPKDKEIAKLVSQLEMGASFISEKSTPAQLDNLETPELLQIENTSESTVDDWIRLDIASPEKTNKIEQWQEIKSNFTNDEQINADESVVLSLDSLEDSNVSVPQAVDQGPPFITHTLIDLYEGQGHLDKAIEVLEKIVQIKPDDKKSLDRLVILKSKLNATEDNYVRDEAELGRSKLMALFDEKIGVQKNSKIDPKDVQVNMEKYGERLLIKLAERAREGSKINSDFE
jgi:tetratricopeptide (TPR) repeat protein